MTKFYLANTPLILTDDNGTDYRVERGEVAELSDAQYEQVAAHVTPVGTPELMQPEPQPENEAAANADSDPAPQPEKAKRGKGDKAE
nr:MAG TPA: hypothetical protein [Caudoviricetes sp.]DAJ60676.1 MAG TPA: hypothetical protein [Caudoviricetes sp.]